MSSWNLRSNRQRDETLPTVESSQGEEAYERLPALVSSQGERSFEQLQVLVVDFAKNDDDVIETSSREFAEAVANVRRTRRRIERASNMENQTMVANVMHNREDNVRPIGVTYINLEGGTNEVIENVTKSFDTNKETLEPENQTPEPPPIEPSITCPICKNPTVEEMTTRCGHIFCRKCITPALIARHICPTCGKKATRRGLVRVFLPSTRIHDECMTIFY